MTKTLSQRAVALAVSLALAGCDHGPDRMTYAEAREMCANFQRTLASDARTNESARQVIRNVREATHVDTTSQELANTNAIAANIATSAELDRYCRTLNERRR